MGWHKYSDQTTNVTNASVGDTDQLMLKVYSLKWGLAHLKPSEQQQR